MDIVIHYKKFKASGFLTVSNISKFLYVNPIYIILYRHLHSSKFLKQRTNLWRVWWFWQMTLVLKIVSLKSNEIKFKISAATHLVVFQNIYMWVKILSFSLYKVLKTKGKSLYSAMLFTNDVGLKNYVIGIMHRA